ncbi:MAG: pyridoxine 5'-phosphate synthase [Planctomycetota bacterium]|jgi:pyridoxine 5-phosphate synthase
MLRLGVNIDHVATIRQARRGRYPEVVAAAHAALLGGADFITMHLREDRRHIQDRDLAQVAEAIDTDINLEMAATPEMVEIALKAKPAQVCIVPERREELTTEGGLDVKAHREAVLTACEALRGAGVPVSLFVDPDEEMLLAANEVGANAVELHTGKYADAKNEAARIHEFQALKRAASSARQLGLRVHAGHGLDYRNVAHVAGLPEVEELNIGFAIVARAVFTGLTTAVREMRAEMLRAREVAFRPEGA